MGMFDELKCEYPLPDPTHQPLIFQTKDLDCLMDLFVITADGRLVQQGHGIGYTIPERVLDDFHGDLIFYTYLGGQPYDKTQWIEYRARFTHGRLETIERVHADEQ